MRLLNKGLKTIVIRVVANESPHVHFGTQPAKGTISDNPRSKRRLELVQNSGKGNNQVQLNDNSKTIINTSTDSVILPLERHAKKHEESIRNISEKLQNKTRELDCFDNKISDACHQNRGHLSARGNCHLKPQKIMHF